MSALFVFVGELVWLVGSEELGEGKVTKSDRDLLKDVALLGRVALTNLRLLIRGKYCIVEI
jgi:hypothetical protein